MADSIPSLRRQLGEANSRISELELASTVPSIVEIVEYVDRVVEVEKVIETVKYETIERVVVEYVDNPEHIRMIEELQGALREWQSTSQSDL